MRYNGSTGTYTVWKTKVASITTKFDGDKEASEPYKVFGNYSQYNPDKLESKDQTYESALKLYKEAVAAQQKKS